jgi:hypothetical protein
MLVGGESGGMTGAVSVGASGVLKGAEYKAWVEPFSSSELALSRGSRRWRRRVMLRWRSPATRVNARPRLAAWEVKSVGSG